MHSLFIPRSLLLCVALVFISSCHHVCTTTGMPSDHTNATDEHSLIAFKSAISADPHDIVASWNDTVHFCEWPGITCGGRRRPERVIGLNLGALGLVGQIPPSLANLTFLREINLSLNAFHGHIPGELALLRRLQYLDLSSNSLEGGIPPELSRCSALRIIRLIDNMLVGAIPGELSYLTSLVELDVSMNRLTGRIPSSLANITSLINLNLTANQLSGSIPPDLGNLSSLRSLILKANALSGGIPHSLGKLSTLVGLNLAFNNLNGAIPPSIWNISSLAYIDVQFNSLSSSLPPDVGQSLRNLYFLSMSMNQFHGPIPMSLFNASNLMYIQLGHNNFSGVIPSNIGRLANLVWFNPASNHLEAEKPEDWLFLTALTNCSMLSVLQLDDNNLGGVLPESIANLSVGLRVLSTHGNHIHGGIPPHIGKFVNLQFFDMESNLLSGPIPASIGMMQNMHALSLASNNFSGNIPSTLGNLTQLNRLYMQRNRFTGSIPTTLQNCRNLEVLSLEKNKLTGTIPKEIFTISALSVALDLSDNSLTGTLPSEVESLVNLGAIDVSRNKLVGEIPVSLGNCLVLQFLFLDGNFFRGTIPSSLSTLRGIQELDLSQNNLFGQIPDFFERFPDLYYLNLSFNNFAGEVPSDGVFANASALSVIGNDRLCGGNPKLSLPTCPLQTHMKKHHSHEIVVIVSIASALVCFLLLIMFLVAARYRVRKSRRKSQDTTPTMKEQFAKVSYAELVKATDRFSAENLIGEGSFGTVYKGILDNDGTKVVAVKVLKLHQQGAFKSFMVECEALRNVRHRNLIKILTACSSVDFKGNDFKAIVFEFMSNGSLESCLHPKANEQLAPKKLDLAQRLNIAIDVAYALDYLHNGNQTPIIHCDLKPSNILLDDDMIAHVGDFGLARLLNETINKASMDSTMSFGLKGTVGYVAPEYGMANRVSAYGDAYSYGILLLEMFTGRRPTDDTFKEGISLRKYVELALPERVIDVVDACLLLQEGMDAARILNCVASLLGIGLLCTEELPAERMGVKILVEELHMVRNRFLEHWEITKKSQQRWEGSAAFA